MSILGWYTLSNCWPHTVSMKTRKLCRLSAVILRGRLFELWALKLKINRVFTSGIFRIWQRGGHGERAEREPITGVWGRSPQRGPGAEPLVGGQGAKPPWSWNTFCFWTFNGSRKFAHFFLKFAGKRQKTHFSYKVACKKFSWSGQGGIAPCPLNTPLVFTRSSKHRANMTHA